MLDEEMVVDCATQARPYSATSPVESQSQLLRESGHRAHKKESGT